MPFSAYNFNTKIDILGMQHILEHCSFCCKCVWLTLNKCQKNIPSLSFFFPDCNLPSFIFNYCSIINNVQYLRGRYRCDSADSRKSYCNILNIKEIFGWITHWYCWYNRYNFISYRFPENTTLEKQLRYTENKNRR